MGKFVCFCTLLWSAAAWTQSVGEWAAPPLERVTVAEKATTSHAAAVEVASIAGGATLVDIDAMHERRMAHMADALRTVPGIWATSDSGGDSLFLSSRGSNLDAMDWDMNGIKLMQDGLPVTTADGNNHNRVVNPLSASHAIVARGANAMRYGASTLGGAINFVSPTAATAAPVDLSLTVGSHGHALGRVTLSRELGESLDGLVTLEGKHWTGYRDHSDQERGGLYANLGWRISESVETRFYGTRLSNHQEYPGALTRAQFVADPEQANDSARTGHYQLNVETARLANRTTWHIDDARSLEIGVSYEEQTAFHPILWLGIDVDSSSGSAPPIELRSLLIDTDQRNWGAVLRYAHGLENHGLLFGINYGRSDVDGAHFRNWQGAPNGLTALVRDAAQTTEAFAMDRWQLGRRTTLIFAAQTVAAERDVRETSAIESSAANPRARYTHVNPRIGFVHALTGGASLYGNVSRLFEPPTNYELEDQMTDGSTTLDPMEGKVVEFGARSTVRARARHEWNWDISVYYAEIEDEILSVENPALPGRSLVTNVDKTVHAGLEGFVSAKVALDSGRSLETTISATVNHFEFDQNPAYGDNELPAAPEHFVRGEVIYRGPNGFYIGPTVEHIGDRWADFANSYNIPLYTTVGLRVGWLRDRWRIFGEFKNVADEHYVANHSVRAVADAADPILNPGEPRAAYVGIQRRFE